MQQTIRDIKTHWTVFATSFIYVWRIFKTKKFVPMSDILNLRWFFNFFACEESSQQKQDLYNKPTTFPFKPSPEVYICNPNPLDKEGGSLSQNKECKRAGDVAQQRTWDSSHTDKNSSNKIPYLNSLRETAVIGRTLREIWEWLQFPVVIFIACFLPSFREW